MLFPLTTPPRQRLSIERGAYSHAVVRTYFDNDAGKRSCLDSRLMSRGAAIKLARRIAKDGTEVEVIGLRYNAIRPPSWDVRRVKRLDEVRLNRVSGFVSAATMLALSTVLMGDEGDEP